MNTINSGASILQQAKQLSPFLAGDLPGAWADWALAVAENKAVGDSGNVVRLAEQLAASAAISTEAAMALMLWLGSVCMINHTRVHWPTGIWQPAGLTIATVEDDGVPIDVITNAFIRMTQNVGLDPIHDTVKEGPAGLISRLESSGVIREKAVKIEVDSLDALAKIDTSMIQDKVNLNRGNARALIYPSGRALLSYLYDTPFFNTLDELIQHGNLNIRGKMSSHRISEVHLSTVVNFYQGSLVTLTNDPRVQNNMSPFLRKMMVFWPTSGTRRHKRSGRIDIALYKIERIVREGLLTLESLSDGILELPTLGIEHENSYIDSGVGTRYTVLDRIGRLQRLSMAVAFWRIAAGGRYEITKGDLIVADSCLHLHEMGGRLFELVMTKGRLGHEFMRIFIAMLEGSESDHATRTADETAHASDINTGATALARLGEMSLTEQTGKLKDEYRFVTGDTIRKHRARWHI